MPICDTDIPDAGALASGFGAIVALLAL